MTYSDAVIVRLNHRRVAGWSLIIPAAILFAAILIGSFFVLPTGALETHEQAMRGQVANVIKGSIDGETYGFALAIERDVDQVPPSDLFIIPGPDPNEWKHIQLTHGPTVLAAGDVSGNGNDELAVVYKFDGNPCPFPVVGQLPCGIVRIYDGPALLQGKLEVVAEVKIEPSSSTCPPSNYPPSAMSLVDVTGDGHAELALGQLGLETNKCGWVHVIPGKKLSGDVTLSDACARVQGPRTPTSGHPDNFGVHVGLFAHVEQQKGYLAVGAPYTSTQDAALTGRLDVYDVTSRCSHPASNPGTPPLAFDRYGTIQGQLLGIDTAYTDNSLWITSKAVVLQYSVPDFKEAPAYALSRTYPLNVAGDLNGDGRPELIVGPYVITLDGDLVLHFTPFAAGTFRGAILGPDHVLSSDRFGLRLWSLTDIWNPKFNLAHNSADVYSGDTVQIYLDGFVSLIPDPWPLEWHVVGGTILERNNTMIQVRADHPGQIVVQATLKETRATLRIPVEALEDHTQIRGPDTVSLGQEFTLRVHSPPNATVTWAAPGAQKEYGIGPLIQTTYTETGDHLITVQVTTPDGATAKLEHSMRVLQGDLQLQGPDTILQGKRLQISVVDPNPDFIHTWYLESSHMGIIDLTGPSIRIPTTGWGPLNVSVVAKLDTGEAVDVGHTQIHVENLPPQIRSFQIDTETISYGFEATATVDDPGGDPITIQWFLNDQRIGTSPTIRVTGLGLGEVNLTVEATDDGNLTAHLTRTVNITDPWRPIEDTTNNTLPRQNSHNFSDKETTTSETFELDNHTQEQNSPGLPVFLIVFIALLVCRFLRNKGIIHYNKR